MRRNCDVRPFRGPGSAVDGSPFDNISRRSNQNDGTIEETNIFHVCRLQFCRASRLTPQANKSRACCCSCAHKKETEGVGEAATKSMLEASLTRLGRLVRDALPPTPACSRAGKKSPSNRRQGSFSYSPRGHTGIAIAGEFHTGGLSCSSGHIAFRVSISCSTSDSSMVTQATPSCRTPPAELPVTGAGCTAAVAGEQ